MSELALNMPDLPVTSPSKSRSTSWSEEALRRISSSLSEPASLLDLRLEARSRLKLTPWPTTITESWRRNNPSLIGQQTFALSNLEELPRLTPPTTTFHLDRQPETELGFFNGKVSSLRIGKEHLASGLEIGSLEEGFRGDRRVQLESMVRSIPLDTDSPAVTLLQATFYQTGSFLIVPDGWNSKRPVVIRSTGRQVSGAILPLNLISVGAGSSICLSLIQDIASESEAWWGAQTRIILEPGAKIELLILNSTSESVRLYDYITGDLGSDSQLSLTWGDMTRGWAVMRKEIHLKGEGARADLNGAFVGGKKSLMDLRTLQDHSARNTFSNLTYKSALFDVAKSVFQGLIQVDRTAVNANAYQLNRNLLLSPKARADSIPKLEILVDEVKCSHGASAGKLDPSSLFYLQSRGLSRSEAYRLMVEGFLAEVTRLLPDDDPRKLDWIDLMITAADVFLNEVVVG
jgi:Fe-S cluster assembly protein SufD